MGNAIMSFGEFHLALTGLANHPKIGVVPVLRDNTPGFGAIDEPHTGMPSPVRIDFREGRFKGFDSRGLAWIHDDTAFYDDIGFLDKILKTRMGEMLPDDEFFGRPVTEAQVEMRDRIIGQVRSAYLDGFEGLKLQAMTLGRMAERLATKPYREGGRYGYGHIDLADALRTRGYALRADLVVEPTEHLFAAGVLLANMRTPWALLLAESSFAAAAVESLVYGRHRDVAAAILYGFGADMRDARAGGLEPNNPMRANAARTWLVGSIERAKSGVDIGARILFGMSEAFRAGDFGTYRKLAGTYVGTLLRHESAPLLDVAEYAVRLSWAQAEQVADGTLSEDQFSWSVVDEDLQLASRYFRDKGEGELADAAWELSKVAHEKGHSGT